MSAPTPPHSPERARRLAAWLILFLAGCGGPTHTAGTSGLGAKDLSILSIPQLPKEDPVQIHTPHTPGDLFGSAAQPGHPNAAAVLRERMMTRQ
jgi:hypothetical protein